MPEIGQLFFTISGLDNYLKYKEKVAEVAFLLLHFSCFQHELHNVPGNISDKNLNEVGKGDFNLKDGSLRHPSSPGACCSYDKVRN